MKYISKSNIFLILFLKYLFNNPVKIKNVKIFFLNDKYLKLQINHVANKEKKKSQKWNQPEYGFSSAQQVKRGYS